MKVRKILLPKQKQFISAKERLVIYLGGIGSGKTLIGAWWVVTRALQKRQVIALTPTYQMGRDSLLVMIQQVLEEIGLLDMRDYTMSLNPITLQFVGGGTIYVRSADAPDRIRGINAHDAYIDEFGSLKTDEAYKVLIGRLRKSEDSQIRLTGTPTPHKWVRNLITNQGARVIRQTTLENTFLPKSYIRDLTQQYGLGSAWYRQEVLGEIVDFSSGVIDTEKIQMIPYVPMAHRGMHTARAWDLAASNDPNADFTASCLASLAPTMDMVIHQVTRWRDHYSTYREKMIHTIINDGPGVTQYIEENGVGQIIYQDLVMDRRLGSFDIRPIRSVKDKVSRAMPFAARVQAGKVSIVHGPWYADFIDECKTFGSGSGHDDQVDAAAHVYLKLNELYANVAEEFTLDI